MNKDLLTVIDEFLAERGISALHFGRIAARNVRLVERLRDGGRVWPETEIKIRSFIMAERKAGIRPSRRRRAS